MAMVLNKPLRYVLQVINYSVFMGMIWYFATAPSIRILDDDQAVLTMAFAHAGELREPCRKLSSEELAELAANMRKLEDCPRERSPVIIEMILNGETLYHQQLDPPGLFGDGGVDVYFSKKIPVGEHYFKINMDDSLRKSGINHSYEQGITIKPAQVLLVGFKKDSGFSIR